MPYAQRGNRTFQEIWLFKDQFLCHIYRQYHADFAPMWVNAPGQSCYTPDRYVIPSYSSLCLENPPDTVGQPPSKF
jgi:hypothetical protein